MALKLHNLKPAVGAKKSKKRVGRGSSSGHGTYSTRGLKGQRSRSGGKGGLKLRSLKANIQKIPKLPGFTSLKPKLAVINLKEIDKNFADGEVITIGKLIAKGLIKKTKSGVKLLGDGKISKKFIIILDKASDSASKAISDAGGKLLLSASKVKEGKKKAAE